MFYRRSGRTFIIMTPETSLATFLVKLGLPVYLCKRISAEEVPSSGIRVRLVCHTNEHIKEVEALLESYPNNQ